MKQLTTAALLLLLVAFGTSCKKELIGEGPITSQTRTINSFEGINLKMNGNVYYKNDPVWRIEVTAKESVHSILETRVENNRLIVRYSNGKTYDNDESIRINVFGPGVSSFELNTSGNIYVQTKIQSPNVYLRSSGAGSIFLQDIETGTIDAESTQSGRIIAGAGNAITERLKTDGSGKIDLSGIHAKSVTARVVGSGDIRVRVSESLDATLNGSGDIYFSGSPLITTHGGGSGSLVRV